MAILKEQFLFNWNQLDAASDLDRFILVRDNLPDEALITFLEKQRGRGRNDYPIRPMWNALIAGIVFQHKSAASMLRELGRNAELRQACGFNPFPQTKLVAVDGNTVEINAAQVPTDDAFGRFLALIIEQQETLEEMTRDLVDALATHLPGLGQKLAVDSKAIPSAGKPVNDEDKKETPDGRRDLDADWGKKTYKGVRKDGSNWEKAVSWFGYKLHLLVDSEYELPLAFEVTEASASDAVNLLPLVEQMAQKHPQLSEEKNRELSADKGYDSKENNQSLHEDHGITPVIDKRTMWREEKTKALFADRFDYFIYDEHGSVFCIDPQTSEQRALYFSGFEKDRGTLKYRCPAAAYGFECKGRCECEAGRNIGDYGRVIRVPLETDPRIFTPIARHTPKWEKAYNLRTSVERVNSRIDRVFGFEKHFIRGKAKMKTQVTLALIVMLAMALGRIRIDQAESMRSLTAPVKRAS